MTYEHEAISIQNLKMTYGNHEVLKGINLKVNRGEIVGYIGPNGAGKSTTIKIILGLITDYTGTIEIFGEKVSPDNLNYQMKLGYVPEQAQLFDQLTAFEYLGFVGTLYGLSEKLAQEKASYLLGLLDMSAAIHQRIDSLSKGMRQKVLIVSSLLHNPDILFLDEPLNGLDSNSVTMVRLIFKKLIETGKTIFFSSHIMEVVENISDRIIVLSEGKILADGDFNTLKKENQAADLENIFNQVTKQANYDLKAKSFVEAVITNEAKDDV